MMTKALSRGLVVIAGLLAGQTAADPDPRPADMAVSKTDPRLIRVKQFFQERDCPAQVYAADFITAADQHDLDWRLLPSLSFIESGGGKVAYNNNMFGWDNCKLKFRSTREGIYRVASKLGKSRMYRKKNVDQVLKLYNPRREYTTAVKAVMSQLGPAELAQAGVF
ncbi:glucosaminidase domain-containing protein [Paludibaculum fermentans]|uniref:Glucosaminidase domain-containing protein n=1 Tax=Paludibaculum fermentans TaxID=1473598 RepID=A0A7S7SKK7_PALFE|nr:glucosaminidase domain-containing protein [Paludibaculum fermentans]QOY87546.1 glucosaminidase domain-containing protein [Paludibaculum fermentans]